MTGWLMGLCLLVFGGGGWLVFRHRLHVETARLRAGFGERVVARARMARELHDALLQSVQGLILRFQLIADDIPRDRPERAAMESALDEAEEVLRASRDQLQDLRTRDDSELFNG